MSISESPSSTDRVHIEDNVPREIDFADTDECGSGIVAVIQSISQCTDEALVDLADRQVLNDWETEDDEVTQITDMKGVIGEDYDDGSNPQKASLAEICGDRRKNDLPADFRLDLVDDDD